MAIAVKRKLSGSTDGRAIKITATGTPGTSVHTAVAGTADGTYDEVWLWATNTSASWVAVTVEFGGMASPDDTVTVALPPGAGLVPVLPGLLLQNALSVRAFAGTANVVLVCGFVNRITD